VGLKCAKVAAAAAAEEEAGREAVKSIGAARAAVAVGVAMGQWLWALGAMVGEEWSTYRLDREEAAGVWTAPEAVAVAGG
jgi:hypothetical protein